MTDELPTWTVIGQVETMDQTPQGNYTSGVKVTFQTRSGAVGSVFVPTDQYSPERVHALITARAAAVEAVAALQG